MSQKTIIEICDLGFCYGRTKALDRFNLSLDKGEVLGLIGKNGAGKTTTIHLLLGLLTSRQGHIRVLGLDPRHQGIMILDRCGFFPEQGEPYEWLRIKDLFRLGRYSYSQWDDVLCKNLCEKLELDSRKKLSDLSKGMQVKAKLIFAIAHRPEILILDEPTNGLDPLSRYDILTFIKSLSSEQQVTVLISSHNLDEVAEIATQICIIDKGRNLFSCSMRAVQDRFAFIEYPCHITLPESFGRHVLCSKMNNGDAYCLISDRTDPDVMLFLGHQDKETVKLKPVNLKELFVFVTRG